MLKGILIVLIIFFLIPVIVRILPILGMIFLFLALMGAKWAILPTIVCWGLVGALVLLKKFL